MSLSGLIIFVLVSNFLYIWESVGEFLEIAGQIGLAVKFAKATELLQRLHLY